MASRTYLPSLIRILRRACVYIVRYRSTILVHLPENGADLLDTLTETCEALIEVMEHPIGD